MSLSVFPWTMNRSQSTACPLGSVLEMGGGESAVVFLHGLFGAPVHWSSIMQDLSGSYRVFAPQLPIDRQNNRRKEGPQTIGDLTKLVARTIDSLELEKFVLCGNSLGGLVAVDYALSRPDRVLGLVLAGSAGLYERSLTNGVKPKPTREFVRSVISDIFYDNTMVPDSLVEEWYGSIQDRDYARFILRISRATRDRCVEDELHRLMMPTMIVWGRDDQITPPDVAEQFRAKIPHAELRYIDQCGHSPNLEQPAAFAAHLSEFLPRCFQTSDRPSKPR